MLTPMMEDARNITAAPHLILVAKNLERIGDHATSIAEVAHYLGVGEQITGQRPKADATNGMTGPAESAVGIGRAWRRISA